MFTYISSIESLANVRMGR